MSLPWIRPRRRALGFAQKVAPVTKRNRKVRRTAVFEPLEERHLLSGTWAQLTNDAPFSSGGIGTMLLLTNGDVLAQGGGVTNDWYELTPDKFGSYQNGTWTQVASMSTERLYVGSQVLPNGDVFVLGGEYSGPQGQQTLTNTGEIYDPIKNTWTTIASFPDTHFGDDPTMLLPNGNILGGDPLSPNTYIYNVTTNSWSQTGTKLDNDPSDEESFVKLPDGSILTYDLFATGAQRYIPSTGQWVETGPVPAQPLSSPSVGFELGPGFLLPDGRVFYLGANGNTAFYTPSTDSWTQGPVIPDGLGCDDAPGAELPNGDILFAADPPNNNDNFNSPTNVFEFNPTTGVYTDVTPADPNLAADPAFVSRMLVLPTGQILFSDGSPSLLVYTPQGAANPAQAPSISSVVQNPDGSYTLTGTQLNGISAGANYGDDAQMDTNYPIVQLTDPTGHVFYARTTNWSNTGVSTGSAVETVNVAMPNGADPSRSLSVTAMSPANAFVNQAFTNSEVATFTDPQGAQAAGDYVASIDWGDGTTTLGTVSGPVNGTFAVDGSHLYTTATNNGSPWVIQVTVSETYGLYDIGSGVSSRPYAMTVSGTGSIDAVIFHGPATITAQPVTGTEGQSTGSVLVATFIDSAGSLPVTDYAATIDWGDNSTTSGTITYDLTTDSFSVVGTHTYTEEGTYLPVISVIDNLGGATGQGTGTATVADAALSPVPVTFNSIEGGAFSGLTAEFTDANPNAPLSDFTATISWGDGTTTIGALKKVSPGTFGVTGAHVYGEDGTYQASITVVDDGGSTTTVLSTANIADAPLTPTTASITSVEGQAIPANTVVATFIDAYSAAPLSDFSATINWGNGNTTAGTITSLGRGNFAVEGGTIYDERGTYAISVAIKDRGGASTNATSSATVADAVLTPSAGTFSGVEGQSSSAVTVGTFNDANIFSQASDFFATINWGDGTTTAGSVVSLSGGNFAVTGTHLYALSGSYQVSANVFDVTDVTPNGVVQDFTGSTATITGIGTVADAPLTPAAPLTLAPTVGQGFTGTVAQFTDPNTFAAPSNYVASIDWGDGTTTPGTITSVGTSTVTGAVTFAVSATTPHAYTTVTRPGAPGFRVNVRVYDLGGSTITANAVANVADAPIVTTGASPVQSVEGNTFNAEVATFTDGNAFAVASDFTAMINWGDGQASSGTISLNTTDPLNPFFVVNGTKAYTDDGLYSIQVTVTDNVGKSGPVAVTQGIIADAPLVRGTVQNISPVAGAPFSGTLATFTDSYLRAPLSDFTATINWGDGTSVIANNATITQPGGVGTPFVVSGSHTYANAASAIPISITVNDAGGSTLSLGVGANVQVALTGAVVPSSVTNGVASGVTRNTRPAFSGQAQPGATVALMANGVNVGETTASPQGAWSITSNTLADGTYSFVADVLAIDTTQVMQTHPLLNALAVDTTGPSVVGVVFTPSSSTLHVTLQDTGSGLNMAGLTYAPNFQLQLPSGRTITTFHATGLTVTPGPAGTGEATVNISYALGRRIKTGGYVVTIMANFITDQAGNTLVERTFVTFPQTTNAPNPNYVAQINVGRGLTASAPQIYVPKSEQIAANQFASRVHPTRVRGRG